MELFNEVKNKYFHLAFKVLLLSGKGLKEEEIIKIVDNEEYEEKVIGKDFKTFDGLLLNKYSKEDNFNFLKKVEGKFYPVVNESDNVLPVRFTTIEKLWLKEFISDPVARDLLGVEIIDKLEKSLKEIKSLNIGEIIEVTNISSNDRKIKKEFNRIFFTLIKGIIEEKPIYYSNRDREGNYYKEEVALPIRIEYSTKNNNYAVSMYSLKENRNILVNLNTIHNVEIAENVKCNLTRKQVLYNIKESRYCKEPVTVELVDRKGAMERFFMIFSQYERTSRYLGENRYEIKINYYTFEEREVVSKLVSLGPFIKVMGPIDIKNKVIMQIVQALELCEL